MADLDLDRELRALGRQLDVPPAPDLTLAVRARLQAAAPRRTPILRYAVVILLLLLSAVLAVPPVRAAVFDFFRVGGVEIHRESGPPVPPTPVLTERPVADLGEAERRQVLVEWNDTEADFPRDRCVHELFEAQAARTPDAPARITGEASDSARLTTGRQTAQIDVLDR